MSFGNFFLSSNWQILQLTFFGCNGNSIARSKQCVPVILFIYVVFVFFLLLSLDWYCIIKKCLHMWCMWLQMIFHFSLVHMSRSNKYAALVECTQSFDRIYRACSNQHFTIVLQHVSFSLPHFVFFDFVYSCCRFHSQCISHMRPFHTKTMHRTSDRMR